MAGEAPEVNGRGGEFGGRERGRERGEGLKLKNTNNSYQIEVFPSKNEWEKYEWVIFQIAVTIARAIELKHKPSIVSALAYETSRMYQDAGETLDERFFYENIYII